MASALTTAERTPQAIFALWLSRQKRCNSRTENLTREELAEIPEGLKALEYAMQPGKPTEIAEALARVARVCRHHQTDPAERKARDALYLQYLCGYPADAFRQACEEWIKREPWYPSISEIRGWAEIYMSERRHLREWLERAQKDALAREAKARELERRGYDPVTGEPKNRPTPEQMERMRRVAAESAAKSAAWVRAEYRQCQMIPVEAPPRPRRPPRTVEFPEEQREALLRRLTGEAP